MKGDKTHHDVTLKVTRYWVPSWLKIYHDISKTLQRFIITTISFREKKITLTGLTKLDCYGRCEANPIKQQGIHTHMITIKIEIPHQITQVMTPRMVMGNYVECDPRVKFLQREKFQGKCTVETKNEQDWANEMTYLLIQATYHDPEDELIASLSI